MPSCCRLELRIGACSASKHTSLSFVAPHFQQVFTQPPLFLAKGAPDEAAEEYHREEPEQYNQGPAGHAASSLNRDGAVGSPPAGNHNAGEQHCRDQATGRVTAPGPGCAG